jgi:pyruvoyl-dependent arginine decarboxylase (PvlArgDC)
MVFSNGNIKEELLKIVLLHGKTRGEDICQSFYASLLEMNVLNHKLVSVTTDGAQAMTVKMLAKLGSVNKIPLS